jgi:hypothetical protein
MYNPNAGRKYMMGSAGQGIDAWPSRYCHDATTPIGHLLCKDTCCTCECHYWVKNCIALEKELKRPLTVEEINECLN